MSKGKMCLILSALIYGIAPMLAKLAYRGGVNGITLTFLRAFLMLPVLAVLVTMRGQSFRLTKKEFTKITALGVYSYRTCDNTAFYISAYNSNRLSYDIQGKNRRL